MMLFEIDPRPLLGPPISALNASLTGLLAGDVGREDAFVFHADAAKALKLAATLTAAQRRPSMRSDLRK